MGRARLRLAFFDAFFDFVEYALVSDPAHKEGVFFAGAEASILLLDGGGASDVIFVGAIFGDHVDGGDDVGWVVVHIVAPDKVGGAGAQFPEGHANGSGGGVGKPIFSEDFDDGVTKKRRIVGFNIDGGEVAERIVSDTHGRGASDGEAGCCGDEEREDKRFHNCVSLTRRGDKGQVRHLSFFRSFLCMQD